MEAGLGNGCDESCVGKRKEVDASLTRIDLSIEEKRAKRTAVERKGAASERRGRKEEIVTRVMGS